MVVGGVVLDTLLGPEGSGNTWPGGRPSDRLVDRGAWGWFLLVVGPADHMALRRVGCGVPVVF